MTIIINNEPAMLKRGSSIEFISENRFLTDADSYTLSITFPLRGCKQNIDIFGHINRKDHDLDRLLLDCEIHERRSAPYPLGLVLCVFIAYHDVIHIYRTPILFL